MKENVTVTIDKMEKLASGDAGKRQRSSIAFPYMDLSEAVTLTTTIHRNVGTGTCTAEQLAAWLRQSPTSSAFRIRLNTSRLFGLVDTEHSDALRLTELGKLVVDPKREREGRAKAFLTVPLYRALYDKLKGGVLPPTAALEVELVSLGVAQTLTERARPVFERSAEQANYFESGRDRLVMPGFVPTSEAGAPSPGEYRETGSGKSGDGGKPTIDPLLRGLVDRLPPADSEWSLTDRVKWLQTAANIFDLIYKGDGGIKIEAATAQRSPRPAD